MNTFEKTIYIGDLHGSHLFNEFIKFFDDGKTEFILLGDLFDRNFFSADIIDTVRRLHEEGKVHGVLGNHDLFFLFGLGLLSEGENTLKTAFKKKIEDEKLNKKVPTYHHTALTYQRRFYWNGGDATMKSFEKKYGKNYKKVWNENVSFLWDNLDLAYVDRLGNLNVHGGIPILRDGSIVGMSIDDKYSEGIGLIEILNKKIKSLDLKTISIFTSTDGTFFEESFSLMEKTGKLKNPMSASMSKREFSQWFLPTWFDNSSYESFQEINKSLIKELDKNGINKIFLGHSRNKSDFFKNITSDDRIFRLDRSFKDNNGKYGNFGYAIVNNENIVLEKGDAMDLPLAT